MFPTTDVNRAKLASKGWLLHFELKKPQKQLFISGSPEYGSKIVQPYECWMRVGKLGGITLHRDGTITIESALDPKKEGILVSEVKDFLSVIE